MKASTWGVKDMSKILVKDSQIPMAEDAWQRIQINCTPGQKAKILIDGKEAVTLETEFVTGIEFRAETHSGTYVDNVELFYKGDPEAIKTMHEKAVQADFERRRAAWAKGSDAK